MVSGNKFTEKYEKYTIQLNGKIKCFSHYNGMIDYLQDLKGQCELYIGNSDNYVFGKSIYHYSSRKSKSEFSVEIDQLEKIKRRTKIYLDKLFGGDFNPKVFVLSLAG